MALQDGAAQAYNEEAFRYFLEIERKRSESSTRPLLLLLVDVRGADDVIDQATATQLFAGLAGCLRETDFVGWYRENLVIGAVLTQRPARTAPTWWAKFPIGSWSAHPSIRGGPRSSSAASGVFQLPGRPEDDRRISACLWNESLPAQHQVERPMTETGSLASGASRRRPEQMRARNADASRTHLHVIGADLFRERADPERKIADRDEPPIRRSSRRHRRTLQLPQVSGTRRLTRSPPTKRETDVFGWFEQGANSGHHPAGHWWH